MDLLGQETVKPQKSKGKKVVLTLLIISIILLILSLIGIFILRTNEKKKIRLIVNGKEFEITENTLIQDDKGKTYIAIDNLANMLQYDYLKGGYLERETDENKGYIDMIAQIIEYKANSNQISKINQNSEIDEESSYQLNNKIIKRNDSLYIALEDLNVGCNVVYSFLGTNKININTTDYVLETYQEKNEEELTINNSINNQRAISYNMMVVTNNEGKFGVMDLNENIIIGYKYSTMEFDEYSQNFIVSIDNNYGVIGKSGRILIEPKYEAISIISYSPFLYKAMISNKYGVLDEEGKVVINIEYDKIGFNENSNYTKPALIIKNLKNNETGIVVERGEKYGIVSLKTGKLIVDCNLDKIYAKTSDSRDKATYYVSYQETEMELNEYIDYITTTTVVTN